MKKYMDEDFLLKSEEAKVLYHKYIEKEPIFDFHNHLEAEEIYEDKKFTSITAFWLIDENKKGDHYKWRLMRANGIPEELITGEASPKEKFLAWIKTLKVAYGNPLYEWSLLELKRYFDIEDPFYKYSDEELYDVLNSKLEALSVRTLLKKSNVNALATTNDPIEDLRWHKLLREDKTNNIEVAATFRPDKATNINSDGSYKSYISLLEKASDVEINSYSDLLVALSKRLSFFKENGTFISDHSIEELVYTPLNEEKMNGIFQKAMCLESISHHEALNFKSNLIMWLAKQYSLNGIAMQLHLKALRNSSKKMFNFLGPDCGFDAINGGDIIPSLRNMFSDLESTNSLPKTVVYSLDPNDFIPLSVLINSFQSETRSKMQLGAAWWFNDNKDGMEKQLSALANTGLLAAFVGMVTDSRSFLSFARHEYFRRVLANYFGTLINNGQIPFEEEKIGEVLKDISYHNAVKYFKNK